MPNRRIPTAIKKARGNPGRRPLPKEPKSERVMPPIPKFKNSRTKTMWKQGTAEFYNSGLITKLSVTAWLLTFERLDDFWILRGDISEEGWTYEEEGTHGQFITKTNPKVKMMENAWRDFVNGLRGFGGDPATLSKVFAGTKEEEANPFADFEVIQGGKR